MCSIRLIGCELFGVDAGLSFGNCLGACCIWFGACG